jgi:hypothetical protein
MSKVFKAVGNAVTSVVKGVVKAVTNVVKAVVNVASSIINFIAQPFMGLLGGMPSAPSAQQEADRQQGVLLQTQGSNVNIPVVYGYRKVGGTVVFAETGSTNNKYLYVAYVFSEGLVEGLREVFIDDWQLPSNLTANLNGGVVVDVPSPSSASNRYGGRVRLQWYPGAYFANARNSPVGGVVKTGIFAEAPSFRDDMDFNGLAVLFARYEWKEIKTQDDADNNPFSGNIPQVQITLLGRRVASLLVDAETFNYDSAPIRYSTNPAEILLDYMRNPRYGKGVSNNDIDWNSWKRAARKCNQTVTYLATQGIQGPILTSNFVLDTGQTIMNNVKTLLMGFRAYMPYVQGKYKLRIEDAGNEFDILSGAAVIFQTFTKDDIVGNVTYTGIEKNSKYTSYAVTYVDPDQKWSPQEVIYPETEEDRQFYINLDGGRENPGQATFPTLTNYAMAKDMARLLFNKSRKQETCTFTATSKAIELEPGDNIRIQSNILNFGTDPWRIVSFKVNDDMTVELGCVRNPDDIYPYARVGEEDIVLPTYVPKGSIIYFPGAANSQLIGLIPPTNALYPSEFISNPYNPGATDPEGSGGGGVGGGIIDSGPIPPENEPPIASPTPVPPINNTPVDPPKPPPFDAVLTYRSVTLEKVDNSTSRFILRFTQPDTAVYDYAIFWWRINAYSAWQQLRLDTKPGAGQEITVTLGPLLNLGQYEYYVRAYATDGRGSSNVTKGYVAARSSTSVAGEFVGIGNGSTQAITDAWAPPPAEAPPAPWYDDDIQFLEIRPKLTGGVPSNPRRLTISFRQLEYAFGNARINPLIAGLRVYYKYRDDTYYYYEDIPVPANYTYSELVTQDLQGDFGSPAYPNSAYNNPTAFQNYDFIVRLLYKDGTTAEKQIGPGRSPVELSGVPGFIGLYDFPVFGTASTAASGGGSRVIPSGFTILDYTQDPLRGYNTGADIIPNIASALAFSQESKIQFTFNPPDNNKFRGYKIRFREIIPGANPQYQEVYIGSTPQSDLKIRYELTGAYRHSVKYEWLISAQYADAGITKDATKSLYARASIPFGLSSGLNLVNSYFNFEEKDTKVMLGELSTAFPAPAAVIPQKWIKKQINRFTSSGGFILSAGPSGDADVQRDSTGQPRLNRWYQLQFQAPNSTFTSLVIYRRVYSQAGLNNTTIGSVSKYYGLGPWERVEVPRSSLTTVSSNVYAVDVRGPIDFTYFDAKYQTAGSTTGLVNNRYGAPPGRFPYPGATPFLETIHPYYGAGNAQTQTSYLAEFLFVLVEDGTEGTKGLRLTEFYADSSGGATTVGFRSEVDGIQSANIPRDDYKTLSDYNTLDSAYNRNLNQALSSITVGQLSGRDVNGLGYPRINSSWTGWQFLLANPQGLTIY